jgi:hypothetical protein
VGHQFRRADRHWCERATVTKSLDPADYLEPYVVDAVRGDRRPAIRIALNLYDNGVSHGDVVTDLLAAAQREVGERWYRNELTVADEHVATGVSAAALDALAAEVAMPAANGLVNAAHREGIPVIAGGRAFGSDPERASRLGADAWALRAAEAASIVDGWRSRPPSFSPEPAEFLEWLQVLLVERGVPPYALIAGLEALRPVVEAADDGAVRLLDAGRQQLVDNSASTP